MWSPLSSNKKESDDEILHRKRVAQILRYIATMQTNQASQFSFISPESKGPFCSHVDDTEEGGGQVLFTWYDFQRLATLVQRYNPGKALPFSFYQASKKSKKLGEATACWLRLTRWTSSDVPAPPTLSPVVIEFLQTWLQDNRFARLETLEAPAQLRFLESRLNSQQLNQIPPAGTPPKFQRWWRRYTHYRAALKLQRQLEPLYNHLFEWFHHQQDSDELIWGLGQAQWHRNGSFLNGPLLEVRVEVELARDGALLVRPKEHAGVTLNRQVMAAITSGEQDESLSTKELRQLVEGYGALDLSPGEPGTYTRLLKQMAVEWSSGGVFCRASNVKNQQRQLNGENLLVTDAWCLYSSPRPSAVWARDAYTFAEKLGKADPITLPDALKALTLGPGALDVPLHRSSGSSNPVVGWLQSLLATKPTPGQATPTTRPAFPLPTSDAQNRIANLLLNNKYPAVVCEGPPGTGKTHTIANIVCAYLCQGKRVLVTSKGAPALSVLRERLPECVQELCVDVSKSESSGMRQLQQTVERLANKVAWVNSEREFNKSKALEQNIQDLENELHSIDERLGANAAEKREIVQTQEGQSIFEMALELIDQAPWLMQTIAKWNASEVSMLHSKLQALFIPTEDPMLMVDGFPSPPSDSLISFAACKAGHALSFLKTATKDVLAKVPLLGSRLAEHNAETQQQLGLIRVNGFPPGPEDRKDWFLVFQRLTREKLIHSFCHDHLDPLFKREAWPRDVFLEQSQQGSFHIRDAAVPLLEKAASIKRIAEDLGLTSKLDDALEIDRLDKRRAAISIRIQVVSEELVAARVVAELSKNFSADAQSALVKFAQVSGKAKFGKSSQASKMTQRQRRKRQEYLDAFEKCVRYIPCWILTSSQISDYLPSECLFDLVVIDEASQSDVTILPGMLRGRQWLIVGDGKQVSPTESFVAEEQIEMLKAAIPESPFEASMLPGHSFFDLCAQAFPMGRVILREHFRCAPEIISYSNTEFYNDNLVPLRLPTSIERLKPSLIDVRVPNGQKIGKINERECTAIVDMIGRYVESCNLVQKRSIGVISLVGDEQSRLIRGRLLDRIGPHKYKLHNILVGEPPSFQGAERDIVFLSMVCSPGAFVTQSQLMHAQRMNVALSRARDRMVLVRSIDTNHIPNEQDVKFSVLDFFERSKHDDENASLDDTVDQLGERLQSSSSPFRSRAECLLVKLLKAEGYFTLSMGVVWDNAVCVENAGGTNPESGLRAAICVEATGESHDEWTSILEQQKSIERVGWKCLRLDAISFLTNYVEALASVKKFLSMSKVFPSADPLVVDAGDEAAQVAPDPAMADAIMDEVIDIEDDSDGEDEDEAEEEIVVVSSDEESEDDRKPPARKLVAHNTKPQEDDSDRLGNGETADDYGNVADLAFLGGIDSPDGKEDDGSDAEVLEDSIFARPLEQSRKRRQRRQPDAEIDSIASSTNDLEEKERIIRQSRNQRFEDDDLSASSGTASAVASRSSSRKRRRKDRYSRDPRWYEGKAKEDDISHTDYMEEVQPETLDATSLDIDDQNAWENEHNNRRQDDDEESYRADDLNTDSEEEEDADMPDV